MRLDNLSGTSFKRVCEDIPNLAILTKSATPGEIQVFFGHDSVGKNPLEETVTDFTLAISIEYLMVVSIDS